MNSTLNNGFRLLEILARHGLDAGVKDLATETGLPQSHVCRLLKTLVGTGYVEQGPSRRYRVSLRVLTLAQARLASLDLRRVGHPFAAQLAADLKSPVYLSAPCEGRSIVVDVVWPREAPGDAVIVVGQVHSVRHSACGKVCAAFASADEVAGLDADCATEGETLPTDAWHDELRRVRERRYAVRDEDGVVAVAAPLFRAEGVFTGAIGVCLSAGLSLAPAVEDAVRRAATAVSFALGQPFSD